MQFCGEVPAGHLPGPGRAVHSFAGGRGCYGSMESRPAVRSALTLVASYPSCHGHHFAVAATGPAAKIGRVKISCVVPAFNEEKLITGSLQRMQEAAQVFADEGWEREWIVCDNNSTDRTAELARAAGAKVVFEPVNQIGRARNTGARAASGDWLMFVDADSHPGRELLAEVLRAMQSGQVLAGGATVRLDTEAFLPRLICGGWNRLSRAMRWMAGSFIFCETTAFRQVGGFNEELFVSEEIDLSKRLGRVARAAGREIVILHRHPLCTSARKMSLYSRWEHLRFFAATVLGGGRTLRDRAACPIWYDGRR